MSVRKYMHPKNIYRTPPNFKELAIEFPEFRKFIKQDVSGKVTIDFKDAKALKALTCTLLKKDFGLDVDIPLNKMIPTVPLRLNYILWIEDLLSVSGEVTDIKGIDIGTGASCIYSLLGAKSRKWSMLATDIDEESITWAQKNIDKNDLNNLITLKKVKGDTLLKEAIGGSSIEYDFCMCNPPFFSSVQELNPAFRARKPDRPRPKNAFCASTSEVVHTGGEVLFIKKIIEESKDLQKQIRIYTTMVGHKSSLPELKALLRKSEVTSFKETEFCQGNTIRWGLAWTYYEIDLRKIPYDSIMESKKQKSKPLQYKVESVEVEFENFVRKIVKIFQELRITMEEIISKKQRRAYCITAYSNTWSHQRRKRREREQLRKVLDLPSSFENEHIKVNLNSEDCHGNDTEPEPSAAILSSLSASNGEGQCDLDSVVDDLENIQFSPKKVIKRDCEESEDDQHEIKKSKTDEDSECLVKGTLNLHKEGAAVVIEANFIEGTSGKEGMHQILQYIKNNWDK